MDRRKGVHTRFMGNIVGESVNVALSPISLGQRPRTSNHVLQSAKGITCRFGCVGGGIMFSSCSAASGSGGSGAASVRGLSSWADLYADMVWVVTQRIRRWEELNVGVITRRRGSVGAFM